MDHPGPSDLVQNTTRVRLLFRTGAVILRELPYEMQPEWVNVQEVDLVNLYFLPCRGVVPRHVHILVNK